MKEAGFLSLGVKDLLKGFILSVISSIVTGLYMALNATPVHFPTGAEFKTMGLVALGMGLSYLMKNWLTNSSDQFLKKDDINKIQ